MPFSDLFFLYDLYGYFFVFDQPSKNDGGVFIIHLNIIRMFLFFFTTKKWNYIHPFNKNDTWFSYSSVVMCSYATNDEIWTITLFYLVEIALPFATEDVHFWHEVKWLGDIYIISCKFARTTTDGVTGPNHLIVVTIVWHSEILSYLPFPQYLQIVNVFFLVATRFL